MTQSEFSSAIYKLYRSYTWQYTEVVCLQGQTILIFDPLDLREEFYSSLGEAYNKVAAFDQKVTTYMANQLADYANWLTAEYADQLQSLVNAGAKMPNASIWLARYILNLANGPYKDPEEVDVLRDFENFLSYIREEYCK